MPCQIQKKQALCSKMNILRTLEEFLDQQQQRLFLWIPVCIGLGIGIYFSLTQEPITSLLWILPLIVAGLFSITFIFPYRLYQACGVAIALICTGFFTAHLRTWSKETPLLYKSGGIQNVHGILESIQDTPNGRKLLLKVNTMGGLPLKDKCRMKFLCKTQKDVSLNIGDIIMLKAKIMPISGMVYPGGYDFRRKSFFEGISGTGFVLKILSVEASVKEDFFGRFKKIRMDLTRYLQSHIEGQRGAITAALLTGDTGAITKATRQRFADSGLAHVLAISGLHLSLIGGMAFLFFRVILGLIPGLLLRVSLFKISAVGALCVALFYLGLAGASIPTQRAFISFALMMAAILLDRDPISLRLVAIAATIVLLLQPEALLSPGFQMSFSAVSGLIGFYEWGSVKTRSFRSRSFLFKMVFFVGSIFVSSFIASLMTLPFTIYHFHKFSLQAVLSNLIVIPLLSFWIMPLGFCIVVGFLCGIPNTLPLYLEQGIHLMQDVATWGSELPGAHILTPSIPLWGLIAVSFGGVWMLIWKHSTRWWGGLGILCFLISFLCVTKPFLFVSSDAKIIGFFTDTTLFISSSRINSFVAESWASRLGVSHDGTHRMCSKKSSGKSQFNCLDKSIFFTKDTFVVAYLKNLDELQQACETADILIVAEPLRKNKAMCKKPKIIIDRFDVFYNGAYMIQSRKGQLIMTTAGDIQGKRPWRVGKIRAI